MKIRFVTEDDTAALLAIYKPYVEKTAITFEYTVPTQEAFGERIRKISTFYPYLVVEEEGRILGLRLCPGFSSARCLRLVGRGQHLPA